MILNKDSFVRNPANYPVQSFMAEQLTKQQELTERLGTIGATVSVMSDELIISHPIGLEARACEIVKEVFGWQQ